ncbi:MAG: ATP-binding cassette domain-containing protein [Acidimicrobiia bacterium]
MILAVSGLEVAYGATVALRGVSLAAGAGEVVAVLGPNGAGKSSLLRAVSGVLGLSGGRVTAGTVSVAAAAAPVGHVLEGGRVFRDLTVEDNLRAGGYPLRDRAAVRRRTGEVLDRFPLLAARRTTLAGLLSGGERQLLAVARALVAGPRLLLLDEPTVGLGAAAVDLVDGVLRDVAAAGAAVVVAEQEPVLASPARTVRLDGGRSCAAPTRPRA